jgi:hypothetical protein
MYFLKKCMKLSVWNVSNPYGPPWPVTGKALPFFIWILISEFENYYMQMVPKLQLTNPIEGM